jgi:2-keto-4-pentenoate hydratase/2-oxohepta-3-ene-1,7-dioic acid hydratase in catechol pathway
MRFVMFDDNNVGVVGADDTIVDISDLVQRYDPLGPEDLLPDLITHYDELKEEIAARSAAGGGKAASEVKLKAPVGRPSKIICLIGNYREFRDDRPLQVLDIFFKSPESIVGDGDTVVLPPHDATIFHHEAEIAMVIGKEAKNVSREEAMDYVFGFTGYNDVSARGLGRSHITSFLGKSFDTFGGFGPAIVTPDEIDDLYNIDITVHVNGEERQVYNTSDIERPMDELVSYISSVTTLLPGDVICCGTNHQGLGAMQDGDEVVTTLSGIGSFTLHVSDERKREWERGIDRETAERVIRQAQEAGAKSGGSGS